MGLISVEEKLTGKYEGVAPSILLPAGAISGGKNIRKVSPLGGWKVRKGSILLNTTAEESGAAFKSFFYYVHPRNGDRHLIGQINNLLLANPQNSFFLLLESGDKIKLESGSYLLGQTAAGTLEIRTDFGTTMGVTVGSTSGFATVVGEEFIYADPETAPLSFGGDSPMCKAFLVYDNSEEVYSDYTSEVTNLNEDNYAVLGSGEGDYIYICSHEIADGIVFALGATKNTATVTSNVYSWTGTAWEDRSAADGTEADGATLAQNGAMTWARDSDDKMSVIGGVMGYWYKVTFSGASSAAQVIKCQVNRDITLLTNKWDGVYEEPTGVRFYNAVSSDYKDGLGITTDELSTTYLNIGGMTPSDFLYIKTPVKAAGIYLAISPTNSSSANAEIDDVEYWNGGAWASFTAFEDGTLDGTGDTSFAQSGTIWSTLSDGENSVMRTLKGDSAPGHWYRISVDATVTANTYALEVAYAALPETLPAYGGCIEFGSRCYLFNNKEYPNRMHYSAEGKHDTFTGADSGYTAPFGGMDQIVCVRKYREFLAVFKEGNQIFLMSGTGHSVENITLYATGVSTVAPKTVKVSEAGQPSMHADEPLSVMIWMAADGVYLGDLTKPKKVSLPVDHYFNPEYSTAINEEDLKTCQAFIDSNNNEYHLLLPEVELVYNFVTDEWYPPFEREIPICCARPLTNIKGREEIYGGTANGFIIKLETDTTDKNTSNEDVAIEHSIKTRVLPTPKESMLVQDYNLRRVGASFKTRSAGAVTAELYFDFNSSATVLSDLSMISSGKGVATPKVGASTPRIRGFELELSLDTVDQEMEIYSILYDVEIIGEI